MMQPKYDVFISHANEDSEKSIELYNALKAEGISCWLDKISGIVDYTLDIPTAVESSLILILLASKSANRPRGGVITECTIALDRDVDVPIHSILIENVQLIELRNLRYFLSSPVERLHAFSHTQAKPVQEIARIIASRVNQIKSENALIENISIINQQEVKFTSVVGRAKQPEKTPTLLMAQGKATPQFSKAQLTAEQSNEKLKEALEMDHNPIKGKSILAAIHGGATNFSRTDKLGRTALHWAAMKGDAEAVKIVLEGDSDVNARNQDEKTPLDLATENGFKEVAALLANAQLKSALSLGQGRSKGESKSEQILRAVRGGVNDFSLTDKAGRTALHWAAMKDDVQAAKIALEGGADANAVSTAKQTPLDLGRASNATAVVALLSAPAKAATPKEKSPIPEPQKVPPSNSDANEQLRLAFLMGKNPTKSKKILEAIRGGVTNFSLTDPNGLTALHWAARKDDVEAAQIALDGNADPKAINDAQQTPLDLAIAYKSTGVVALLSAPLEIVDPSPEPTTVTQETTVVTQLTKAEANKNLRAALNSPKTNKAKFILQAVRDGATDLAVADKLGRTPLHWAAAKNDVEVIKLILSTRVKVDAETYSQHETPLCFAAKNNSCEAARILIENGANVNHSWDIFSTPLSCAAEGDHVEVAQVLIDHGADIRAVGSYKMTLRSIATYRKSHRFLKFLKEVDPR